VGGQNIGIRRPVCKLALDYPP